MDLIKTQLKWIQQQLGALGASQKMLAAALLVIMGITIYWWARYAGQAEMEPVLDQALAAEDVSRIKTYLASKGISYKIDGDRVMVPVERKMEALADLAYAQLLPRDTKDAFQEIIAKGSPFAPQRTTDALWNKAREATLAQVLTRFPQVSHAMVLIDTTERRAIGDGSIQPSAMVAITMRSGVQPDRKLVDAAADLVCGAVANLPRAKVKVVVDGVSYKVRDRDDPTGGGGGDWFEQMQQAERYYGEQVGKQLSVYPGVMVSVHVQVNSTNMESEDVKYDAKNKVGVPTEEETTSIENNTPSRAKDEPGAVPNAGMILGGGGSADAGARNTNEHTRSRYEVRVPESRTRIRTPGGNAIPTGASIFVPHSYFVAVYRKQNGDSAKEPTMDAIKPLIDTELPTIRSHAARCLGLADEKTVEVGTYMEAMPALATGTAAASASSVPLAITSHVKEIAVGGLALVSLFMVSMMVRKSAPVVAVAEAPVAIAQGRLAGAEEAVGEVGEGDMMLDGKELDDDSVRTQQMVDQVSTLVKENPDAAANLVKRWMNRS